MAISCPYPSLFRINRTTLADIYSAKYPLQDNGQITMPTISEKILSRAARKQVAADDFVIANIDYSMAQDGTGVLAVKAFKEMGVKKVWDQGRIIIQFDHACPYRYRRQIASGSDGFANRELPASLTSGKADATRFFPLNMSENNICTYNISCKLKLHDCN